MNDSVSPEKFLGRKGTRNIDLKNPEPYQKGPSMSYLSHSTYRNKQ
jgi:hypothetical protein